LTRGTVWLALSLYAGGELINVPLLAKCHAWTDSYAT
jgi:hypothetical protein